MNPKNSIIVGVLVLMMAMAVIPAASALTITRTQFDLVPGTEHIETYAAVVGSDNLLYIAGVNQLKNELAVYTWGGQNTVAVEKAAYDMNGETYIPTDILEFENSYYITTLNYSNIGIGGWQTKLFVYDPSAEDIDVAATFPHAMLVQETVYDDQLVIGADQNYVYVSDNGEDFTGYALNPTPLYFYEGVFYANDIYVLGVATVQDTFFVETRNCTSVTSPNAIKNPNQPMSAPNNPNAPLFTPFSDQIQVLDTTNFDDAFSTNTTQLSLSRTINFRAGVFNNYTNPLYALPDDSGIAIEGNSAVYVFNPDYDFTRAYNGDSVYFNPTPIYGSPLTGANKDSRFYVNTIDSANQAPSCPATLFEPPRPLSKPIQKEQKVSQSFGAQSAQTITRVVFDVNMATGETNEVFSYSAASVYKGLSYSKGSYLLVTSSGIYAYHQVALDLTGAINSLFLALLIIGIIFIAFGIASWNRGFEDVIALSLGGALITDAILLYLFPSMYLTWLLLLVPIATFFIILYAIIKTYNLEKIDFRLQHRDALIIVVILVALAIFEYFTGYIAGAAAPFWIP